MKFVALVAPKQGGKDTSYELLVELKRAHGKISFAGPLKEICSKVFNIPIALMHDPVLKEKPLATPVVLTKKHLRDIKHECTSILDPQDSNGNYLYNPNKATTQGLEGRTLKTPREVLQVIGTDFIRDRLYKDWHVRAAFAPKRLAKLSPKNGIFCVTDARFANEYQFLKDTFKESFVGFYVERPEAEAQLEKATHESELGVKQIKALLPPENIIKNDGDLADLKAKLKELPLPKQDGPSSVRSSKFKFAEEKK